MSREPPGVRWPGAGQPPAQVEVTLLEREGLAPARRLIGPRTRRIIRPGRPAQLILAALAAAAVLAWAVAVGVLGVDGSGRRAGHGHAPAHAFNPRTRLPGAAGIAAAYGYPTRCVVVTITHDGAYARADFSHKSFCGRFAGNPTAIFHRTRGTWRRVLYAVAYRCPVDSIPGVVQRRLAVCQ